MNPNNANVDATNGVMSIELFFRDHTHASPNGRVAAPFTAAPNTTSPR